MNSPVFPASTLAAAQDLWLKIALHDPSTAAHCQRVANELADFMRSQGASPRIITHAYLAGLLHDAGKVHVPRKVLGKSGSLTSSEWAIIRRHPLDSESLVQQAGMPEMVLRAVRSHHERWNGEGYPDGLSASGIPWLARILSVFDAVDVMRYGRTYAKPLTEWQIQKELERAAGAQFDPKVVEQVLAWMKERPSATGAA